MIKCRTPAIQTPQKNEHAAAPSRRTGYPGFKHCPV